MSNSTTRTDKEIREMIDVLENKGISIAAQIDYLRLALRSGPEYTHTIRAWLNDGSK